MNTKIRFLKLSCLVIFIGLAAFMLVSQKRFAPTAKANAGGPPTGNTGAPGETTCASCHNPNANTGQFAIMPPENYTPGETYQITVRHTTNDGSRRRWGFQLTALDGSNAAAGTFASISNQTQVLGTNTRLYIEHTAIGTFPGQTNGAVWTFNWTAPASDVGPVTFYAAGNQANNDGTNNGDQIYTTNAVAQPSAAEPNKAAFDLDGDGRTDVGIFRPAPAEWWYLRSIDGQARAFQFGQTTDRITPADFTGDGATDIAFFRPGTGEWFVLRSEDSSFFSFPFGTQGDIPAPADFDGDGTDDPAIFRPSAATWFYIRSSDGQSAAVQFGLDGDVPIPADYDADGMADLAVFRPSAAEWFLQRTTAGFIGYAFGAPGSTTPVSADYTGDGTADVAFFNPNAAPGASNWFVLRSDDESFFAFPFGVGTDIPVPGDYDGDGRSDPAVFRPSNNTWFLQQTTDGFEAVGFGINGDVPIPSAFIP